jgi:hypothetical protein
MRLPWKRATVSLKLSLGTRPKVQDEFQVHVARLTQVIVMPVMSFGFIG